jgi:hypothetical protein
MRLPTYRGLSVPSFVVALTAFSGAGTAEARPSAPAAHAQALSVSMNCEADAINCQAIAIGGTGGYAFTWTNANHGSTEGNSSEASPHCWSGHTKFTVSVTVTDGTAATATASRYFVCP